MQTNQLKRNKARISHKQIGRGGKRGKTSGKGHKGQKLEQGTRSDQRSEIKLRNFLN